jgi:hypothetical protein
VVAALWLRDCVCERPLLAVSGHQGRADGWQVLMSSFDPKRSPRNGILPEGPRGMRGALRHAGTVMGNGVQRAATGQAHPTICDFRGNT